MDILSDEVAIGFQCGPNTARPYGVGNIKVLEASLFMLWSEHVMQSFCSCALLEGAGHSTNLVDILQTDIWLEVLRRSRNHQTVDGNRPSG